MRTINVRFGFDDLVAFRSASEFHVGRGTNAVTNRRGIDCKNDLAEELASA